MNHQGQSLQQSSPSSSSEKGNDAPKHAASGAWNEEIFEKAKELFLGGMSAKNIAERFGMSRNSVFGKMFRMGVRSPNTKVKANAGRPKLRIVRANTNSNAMRVLGSIERGPLKIRSALMPPTIWLHEPRPDYCNYPYGDGPFVFCGHLKLEGSSYCGPHHALCWMPPHERRR